MLQLVAYLSLIPLTNTLSFFSRQQSIECGQAIAEKGSYILPSKDHCLISIIIPAKSAVQLTFSGDNKRNSFHCSGHEKDIIISDASSTEFYLPCKNGGDVGVFVGNQREYLISVRYLPPGTVIGMNYYETYFGCDDVVPFDLVGLPLTLVHDKTEENCNLMLPGRVKTIVTKVKTHTSVCSSKIHFEQGPRLGDMSMASKSICSDALPFGYNIYCSSGLLVFSSKLGQSLQFLLVAPTESELEDYRSSEYKCETSFLH